MNAPTPLSVAIDRHLTVPVGYVVKTGYVPIHDVVLACKDRMAIGDVEASYRRLLQVGDNQVWPCPYGYWGGDRFVIQDGRHEYVASLMLGRETILVAWVTAEEKNLD